MGRRAARAEGERASGLGQLAALTLSVVFTFTPFASASLRASKSPSLAASRKPAAESNNRTISVLFFILARSNAVTLWSICDGEGGRAEVEAAAPGREGGVRGRRPGWRGRTLGGAERGGAAPVQAPSQTPARPSQTPARPSPRPTPRLPPRPSALLLTALRLASAPALSSDSTQGAWPCIAAKCSADNFFCRDAAAAPHTRVSGGGGRADGGCLRRMRPPSPPRAPLQPQPRSLPCRLACEPGGRGSAASSAAAARRSGGGAQRRRRGTARLRGSEAAVRSLPRSPPTPTPLAATSQQGRGAPCPGHSGWRPWLKDDRGSRACRSEPPS